MTAELDSGRPGGIFFLTISMIALGAGSVLAGPREPSAERGRRTLLTTPLVPASWPRRAYDELWKRWGLAGRPADFDAAVRERYGLHPAPFENGGLPMGLRAAKGLFPLASADDEGGGREGRVGSGGLANDCLLCHAGSIAGKSIIGLGNSSLDLQALMEDLWAPVGVDVRAIPALSHQRGTVEAVSSIHFLMRFRDRDLNRRFPLGSEVVPPLIEDIPAWWLLRKKRTMLHTGALDARAVRPFLTFMLSPLISGKEIRASEGKVADILAFARTLEAPRYPFEIDRELAKRGERIFEKTCSRCHGRYGEDASYPNRLVSLDEIGTDATLARETFRDSPRNGHYMNSWFAGEKWDDGPARDPSRPGYQAPPLDGIWATAPYFHNGSVPTVFNVLDSGSRPRVWTRGFRNGAGDYDRKRLGWKVTIPGRTAGKDSGRRRVYDTTLEGRGNAGHEFGDELDEGERAAVIEYLKTL